MSGTGAHRALNTEVSANLADLVPPVLFEDCLLITTTEIYKSGDPLDVYERHGFLIHLKEPPYRVYHFRFCFTRGVELLWSLRLGETIFHSSWTEVPGLSFSTASLLSVCGARWQYGAILMACVDVKLKFASLDANFIRRATVRVGIRTVSDQWIRFVQPRWNSLLRAALQEKERYEPDWRGISALIPVLDADAILLRAAYFFPPGSTSQEREIVPISWDDISRATIPLTRVMSRVSHPTASGVGRSVASLVDLHSERATR